MEWWGNENTQCLYDERQPPGFGRIWKAKKGKYVYDIQEEKKSELPFVLAIFETNFTGETHELVDGKFFKTLDEAKEYAEKFTKG